MKRRFGKTNFYVTTLGLGGQAAIQWTPQGVIPANIITKAIDMGVNYFDTSNVYGKSQLHFNTAFIQRNLIPGISGYNETLRELNLPYI
jgi:aryl-alcohol dehydrogenase-like predicted oxidoreductase